MPARWALGRRDVVCWNGGGGNTPYAAWSDVLRHGMCPNEDMSMAASLADRDSILRTVETWPVEDRVAFAQAILRRVAEHRAQPQRPAWRQLAGLASAGQPPPVDEEVARWLDEHRSEK